MLSIEARRAAAARAEEWNPLEDGSCYDNWYSRGRMPIGFQGRMVPTQSEYG